MNVKQICPLCYTLITRNLDISGEQFNRWVSGELIQDVMPQLGVDDREWLITGLCRRCDETTYAASE